MNVLVSACIVGDNCKYSGRNNYNPDILHFSEEDNIIKICPKLLAKMTVPRKSAEIAAGVVKDIEDFTMM